MNNKAFYYLKQKFCNKNYRANIFIQNEIRLSKKVECKSFLFLDLVVFGLSSFWGIMQLCSRESVLHKV